MTRWNSCALLVGGILGQRKVTERHVDVIHCTRNPLLGGCLIGPSSSSFVSKIESMVASAQEREPERASGVLARFTSFFSYTDDASFVRARESWQGPFWTGHVASVCRGLSLLDGQVRKRRAPRETPNAGGPESAKLPQQTLTLSATAGVGGSLGGRFGESTCPLFADGRTVRTDAPRRHAARPGYGGSGDGGVCRGATPDASAPAGGDRNG